MNSQENRQIYAKIVAKAWADDAFKAHFLKDPTKTARDFGMHLPPTAVVTVVEEGEPFSVDVSGPHPKLIVLLPARPADLEEKDLLLHSLNRIGPCVPPV